MYVYANDSDLIVLGVRSLLWEVLEHSGTLTGKCIQSKLIFEPASWAFSCGTDGHAFLRQLHGLPKQHDRTFSSIPLSEENARARLVLYAIVVGNDFANFVNVGPAAAAKLTLQPVARDAEPVPFEALVGELAYAVVTESREDETLAAIREAREKLQGCYNMFHHALVINSSRGITKHTGQ